MIELAFFLTFKACVISQHKCADFPVTKEFKSSEECYDARDALSQRAYEIVIQSMMEHNKQHPEDPIIPISEDDLKVVGICEQPT